MAYTKIGALVLLATVLCAGASSSTQTSHALEKDGSSANPIRRVVNMLQMMAKKVAAEGEKEEELFDKFMCYCETSGSELEKSIDEATAKVEQLESDIKEAEALKAQLEEELTQHRQDRADAKAAIEKATAIRMKEKKEFDAENAESNSNIDALGRAIPAIEKGMAGSFLQTKTNLNMLKNLVESNKITSLTDYDRNELVVFLAAKGEANEGYAPASGEILGILKQMKDEMEADLKEMIEAEEKAVAEFNELVAAKEKEIATATKAIEDKLGRLGEVSVQLAEMKNDLEDTGESLSEDKKFLADLAKNCEAKKKEWALRQKTRQEEILALQETIKILNDDDALELFKKTLPSAAAFVQVDATATEVRHQALAVLKSVQGKRAGSTSLDLITMALSGKKVNFDKVLKMIDDMVVLLKKEQTDDDNKKEYCEVEIDLTEDKIKETTRNIGDLESKIADTEEGIKTTMDEIKALKDGIANLDRSVVEATNQRKEENADYTTLMAQNTAAAELIGFAKNRMNKFYNPKMYKPPPKRELTEEERITLNMGGTLEPTAPPGGIAGTGIGLVQAHAAPPPPPETFGEGGYKKKGEESNGVIGMMDMLIGDLEKEMTEAKAEESNAQEEYEQFMADSKEKRALDSKSVVDKEAAKAQMDSDLQMAKDSKSAEEKELKATKQFMADLHEDCDWLLENFDARKTARAEEIDALGKAKAVLSGADFSFMQTGASTGARFLGARN